jgi:hypothetical protein
VTRFHEIAARTDAAIMRITFPRPEYAKITCTFSMDMTAPATIVPPNMGPRNSKNPTIMIALLGLIAPEEIMVAMMLLTSCRPLVNAKITMQRSVKKTMRVASVMMKNSERNNSRSFA